MNDDARDEEEVKCAFCGSTDTEMISLFGGTLMSSQYYCNKCRTVFEAVRWTKEEPAAED